MNALRAAGRIQDWLLHSNIVVEAGAEAGAVAGWLDEQGAPAFAYPEITGYYLTCMAFTGRFAPAARSLAGGRACRAADWLAGGALPPGPPLTRQHLHPQMADDWRNAGVFAFDLAMVVRGITHARRFVPSSSWQPLLAQHLTYLLDLCTPEGMLQPVQLRAGHRGDELPATWSTAEGAHHVKTAAAILAVPPALLPARLSAAARNLLARWVGEPWPRLQLIPTHPLFYYLEGLVSLAVAESDPGKLDEVAAVYAAVMQRQDAGGFLPPDAGSAHGGGPVLLRSDVIAQALRIGSLLKAWGYLAGGAWDARLAGLAKALLTFAGPDGGVAQHPLAPGAAPQWNAWCSMFAYQALTFYGSLVERAAPPPDWYAELLI